MKKFSAKVVLLMFFLCLAGLYSASLWMNIAGGIGAVVMIIFIHLDNMDFCRKLDRVASGDKDVKF